MRSEPVPKEWFIPAGPPPTVLVFFRPLVPLAILLEPYAPKPLFLARRHLCSSHEFCV